MGTGWRRAFCTAIPSDQEKVKTGDEHRDMKSFPTQQTTTPGPRNLTGSNASTPHSKSQSVSSPRLRCLTSVRIPSTDNQCVISPKVDCTKSSTRSPKATLFGSDPSSPRSPFSILKNSLGLSRNYCGVCLHSVKTGQGIAIFTAECSHSFHFPCIIAHVRKQSKLVCPVCNSVWKDVPLLAIHSRPQNHNLNEELKSKLKQSDHSTTFDDDEPLPSPITIPKVKEYEKNVEDEIQEFEGFFVNPIQSEDLPNTRSVEVSMMPNTAVVSCCRTHDTYAVVLKLKAPPLAALKTANLIHSPSRAAIDLVTVLDVSGSMRGAKLHMLKRAIRLVISSLCSADRLSIVAFSSASQRLMPLRRMTPEGQQIARGIVDRLVCGQGTCVGEALRKATKVLGDRRERNPVASIMLLSDGQDGRARSDNGDQRQRSTTSSSTRFAHVEIPVQPFCLGQVGGYLYDDEDAFTKCVGGFLSVVVQDLRVKLGFAAGSDPGEISAVYSFHGRLTVLNSDSVRLGDLYAEEEREILVKLKVPPTLIGHHHVLAVVCSYKDPATNELINGAEQALLVPRVQAVGSSSPPPIERLRGLFVATQAISESRRLVERNEIVEAQQILASTLDLLIRSNLGSVNDFVHGLEAELAEVEWRRRRMERQREVIQQGKAADREIDGVFLAENGEPLTPTSAWRVAERLTKVRVMHKLLNRVRDLHGFENARF